MTRRDFITRAAVGLAAAVVAPKLIKAEPPPSETVEELDERMEILSPRYFLKHESGLQEITCEYHDLIMGRWAGVDVLVDPYSLVLQKS